MPEQIDIPSPYYRVSLKAIVLDEQQRLLVIQTADNKWELPGGGWEHGETMEQCLGRELLEEIGVELADTPGTSTYPYVAKGRTGLMRLKLALPVVLASYDFTFGDGIQAAQFIDQADFATLDMIATEAGIKQYAPQIWSQS